MNSMRGATLMLVIAKASRWRMPKARSPNASPTGRRHAWSSTSWGGVGRMCRALAWRNSCDSTKPLSTKNSETAAKPPKQMRGGLSMTEAPDR